MLNLQYMLCPKVYFFRGFARSTTLYVDHYTVLELSQSATQADIKNAFYKLSKKYHPDKNQGSAESEKKYLKITAAYEVLGNEKSRQIYDRRNFPGARAHVHTAWNPNVNNSNFTTNNQSRNKDSSRPSYQKGYKYYNIEEWDRQHYSNDGKTNIFNIKFKSKSQSPFRENSQLRKEKFQKYEDRVTYTMWVIVGLTVSLFIISMR